MSEFSTLYEPAKQYVKAAFEYLKDRCPESPPQIITGLRDWVRSGTMFRLRDREEPFWVPCIRLQTRNIHALAAYHHYEKSLRDHPLSRGRIGLVLTATGGRGISLEEIADRLLWQVVEDSGAFQFNEARFDSLFAAFEAELGLGSIDYVTIATVPGFKSDRDLIPLGTNIELSLLSDPEIARCLRISAPLSAPLGGDIAQIDRVYGLRIKYSLPIFHEEVPQKERDAHGVFFRQLLTTCNEVVHALRLFKRGKVAASAVVTAPQQWPFDGFMSGSPIEPGGERWNSYELSGHETEEFSLFWKRLTDVRKTPFLDAAIRRFAFAGERTRAEDRLVDLIISAETLFLSDAGETKERTELRFRLALRFAFFSMAGDYNRFERFRLMRNAYDARSSVVHGGTLDASLLKLPKGGKVEPQRFVDEVEELLRGTLHQAVQNHPPHSKFALVDWDKLILSESSPAQ